jgi:hypothetical protein
MLALTAALALLLAGDPSFDERWDAYRGKADREQVLVPAPREPEPEQATQVHRRPQEARTKRPRATPRHHRKTRFQCHRVYTTKYKWHCQRRGK